MSHVRITQLSYFFHLVVFMALVVKQRLFTGISIDIIACYSAVGILCIHTHFLSRIINCRFLHTLHATGRHV